MEVSTEQEQDVVGILTKHPIGIKYETLWSQSSAFADKVTLSRVIHQMSQLHQVYKKDDLYFLTGNTASADTPSVDRAGPALRIAGSSIKDQARARVVAARAPLVDMGSPLEIPTSKASEVLPIRLKEGSVPHTKGVGAASLALYKCRNDRPLVLQDIIDFTGASKTTLYTSLALLEKQGYIKKDATNSMFPKFSWSGEYRYPFAKSSPKDDDMLQLSYKDWAAREVKEPETTALVVSEGPTGGIVPALNLIGCQGSIGTSGSYNSGDNDSKVPNALRLIDTQISMLEQNLEQLRSLRSILCP